MTEQHMSRSQGAERLLLRIPEAAEMTGLGRSKAYELVASGEWPSVMIGRSVRVPLTGLRAWVNRQEELSRQLRHRERAGRND